MNRKIISIILVLLLITNPLLPWIKAKTVSAEKVRTLTISDETLYNRLKSGIIPTSAIKNSNDSAKTIQLDMEAVTVIQISLSSVDITANRDTIEALFSDCTNLESLLLCYGNLSTIDFSGLRNKTSMTYLSLDSCSISNIDFIQDMNNLTTLSFGDDKLTDDSITAFLNMSSSLSGLTTLNLGKSVHEGGGRTSIINAFSGNKFTNIANLALIPEHFPKLTNLDLSGLQIESLQDFVGIRACTSAHWRADSPRLLPEGFYPPRP